MVRPDTSLDQDAVQKHFVFFFANAARQSCIPLRLSNFAVRRTPQQAAAYNPVTDDLQSAVAGVDSEVGQIATPFAQEKEFDDFWVGPVVAKQPLIL